MPVNENTSLKEILENMAADMEKLEKENKTLDELYLLIKEELRRADVTHSLGQKKEMFKNRMEVILDNLKIEL